MSRKYFPGDRVRYLGNGERNTDKLIDGEVYTVDPRTASCYGTDSELILTEVEKQYGNDGWFFSDRDFELVQTAEDAAREQKKTSSANDAWDRAFRVL